ncbi:DUF1963 domain-containing protein [Sphaerospermopsis kisseleviana CS-549]|uniref:DUF1963 domain-containing protein n=1 Tax=Sphaerospermopsis kisseleviana CS-549 TaxID=3021783 RepID=A0ABT4ZRH9_9CYAN|nr:MULTISPECIES: DUF1963 domain-containing protein [Sphaerospermopsis]MBD2135291.1 DUF1963 domain-containing protein [Sphaerospermopsis sp. FACHB-1094]MDB9442002.1 DUF1963 domain-containing protein [Sphaerospermopsis kisseleviana CS-549]BAZ78767.1 hypothetical protein NIES73_00030 [Sphaerospermopsis kisseleviana NIES-73]
MPLKTQFQIIESLTEILDPVTKFGGQPVWIAEPLWPLGPETGEQMLFLGQIALNHEIFPDSNGIMVYLFFEQESEPLYNEAFAIVIQTTENVYTSGDQIEFLSATTGPTIYELNEDNEVVYQEYGVILEHVENEDSVPLKERYTINDLNYDPGYQFARPELAGNKIGGQPLYIGHLTNPPELFTSDEWLLLLQLAPTQGYYNNLQPNFYPFYMELGEFGILTVFISQDYTQAVCYVQQP